MTRDWTTKQRGSRTAALDLDAELARISSLTIDQLRGEWRECIGLDLPPALTKDLLARALSHRLQEKVLGGISPLQRRALDALAKGDQAPRQRVKLGSVLVREHEGKLHEVSVVHDGFSWQGKTYASLSTIARMVTGTKWNGPRFFGLRDRQPDAVETEKPSLDRNIAKKGFQARSSPRPRPSEAFIRDAK